MTWYEQAVEKLDKEYKNGKYNDTWLKWLEDGSKRDADGKPVLPKRRKAKVSA